MAWTPDPEALRGRVAVVAGATRAPGAASPPRSARPARPSSAPAARRGTTRSDYDRPETIEETADARHGARRHRHRRSPVDHLDPAQVARARRPDAYRATAASTCSSTTSGAERCSRAGRREWDTPIWEHDLDAGLRILRLAIDTHLDHVAPPAAAARRPSRAACWSRSPTAPPRTTRRHYRISVFYDLAKVAVNRLALLPGPRARAARRRPRWRSRPASCDRR